MVAREAVPRWRPLAGAALLGLAACSSQPAERDARAPEETARTEVDAATPHPTPIASAPSGSPQPGATLPPANSERRYVGRWATRADLCEGGAWVFARDHFGLEDGPMCDFERVTAIPGGYRITAQCDERGKRTEETVTLRFAESAQAMLVEGLASLPEAGLVYCGPA